MTPKEFAEEMQRVVDDEQGDSEGIHARQDDLMLRLLTELGYGAGCDIWKTGTKWFA